jgi:transcriptional regulator with XRE-family HTH domain
LGHADDGASGFSEDEAGLGAGEKFVRLTHVDIMSQWVMSVKRYRMLILACPSHLDAWRTCAYVVYMTQQVNFGQVPPVTLGWRIQLALDYAQLKQDVIASKFEVSRKTVSRWCNDVGTPPKKFILNEIAVMCEVSPRWLIDGIAPDGHHPLEAPGGRGLLEGLAEQNVVEIPRGARVLVVGDDGIVNEDATHQIASLTTESEQPAKSLTLRLTAECAANCATGDYDATLPDALDAAA